MSNYPPGVTTADIDRHFGGMGEVYAVFECENTVALEIDWYCPDCHSDECGHQVPHGACGEVACGAEFTDEAPIVDTDRYGDPVAEADCPACGQPVQSTHETQRPARRRRCRTR